MSNDNAMPDNMDEAKGRAKQAVGSLTDNEDLKKEGQRDEAAGDVKDTIETVSDKAKDAVDDVQKKLS